MLLTPVIRHSMLPLSISAYMCRSKRRVETHLLLHQMVSLYLLMCVNLQSCIVPTIHQDLSMCGRGRGYISTSSNVFLVFANVCESTVLYCTHHSPGSFNVWQGQGIYLYFIKYFPCIHVGMWVNRYVIRYCVRGRGYIYTLSNIFLVYM